MKLNQIKQNVFEGSGPKEKQKTPFRDINSPAYKAAAEQQKQRMEKDKAAEAGKKLLAKQKVSEGLVDGIVVHNYTKTPIELKPGEVQIHGWGPNEQPIYRVKGHDGKEVITSSKKKMAMVAQQQGVAEGKHTQHYMDANKPSKDRQEAEAKKAGKKQTKWSEDPIAAATDRVYDKVAGMLGKKKQEVSEGEWGWDDPRYDRRPSGRNEDDEYEQYRQSKLDDQIEKKPMGFQVYDGTSRQYIGKVFRSQADAVQFRAVQPGREHMSIQMVPLQESDSKNPHTSLLGRALYSALTKQMKTQHKETVLESDQRKVNAIRA